jgi:hypothetical protein
MKLSRRSLLLPVAALWLVSAAGAQNLPHLPRARAESVGVSSERLARLPEVFRGYVKRGEVAGVVAPGRVWPGLCSGRLPSGQRHVGVRC